MRQRSVCVFYFALACLFGAFSLVVGIPISRAVQTLCYAYYDLGIYSEALAKISLSDVNPWLSARQIHIFNDHFDPILLVLMPWVHALGPVAAACVADLSTPWLAILPVVWLLHRDKISPRSALLLCILLVCNTAMLEALHFPAHPTTWATAPMVWMMVFLLEKRFALAIVALTLLFACKEEFPFVGLPLAAVMGMHRSTRRWALAVGCLSVAWLAAAFGWRLTWGPVNHYGEGLFAHLMDEPWTYLRTRISTPGMLSRLGSLALTLAPLTLWRWHNRTLDDARTTWCRKPVLGALVVLSPLLCIRFLGMAWRHHYMAVVMGGMIAGMIPWVSQKEIPRWVLFATLLLLISTNTNRLKYAWESWVESSTHVHRNCPRQPDRLASIDAAVQYLKQHPGKVLLQQNLALPLVSRDDIYVVGGSQQHAAEPYRYVLLESEPYGNTWPESGPTLRAWLAAWQAQADTESIIDDGHVWLGRGSFFVPAVSLSTLP